MHTPSQRRAVPKRRRARPRWATPLAVAATTIAVMGLAGCASDDEAGGAEDRPWGRADELGARFDDLLTELEEQATGWGDDLERTASSIHERLKTDTGDSDDMRRLGRIVELLIPDVVGYEVLDGGLALELRPGTFSDRYCRVADVLVDDPSQLRFHDGAEHSC